MLRWICLQCITHKNTVRKVLRTFQFITSISKAKPYLIYIKIFKLERQKIRGLIFFCKVVLCPFFEDEMFKCFVELLTCLTTNAEISFWSSDGNETLKRKIPLQWSVDYQQHYMESHQKVVNLLEFWHFWLALALKTSEAKAVWKFQQQNITNTDLSYVSFHTLTVECKPFSQFPARNLDFTLFSRNQVTCVL